MQPKPKVLLSSTALLIIVLVLCSAVVQAQDSTRVSLDSMQVNNQPKLDSITQLPGNELDSLSRFVSVGQDSLKAKPDSLLNSVQETFNQLSPDSLWQDSRLPSNIKDSLNGLVKLPAINPEGAIPSMSKDSTTLSTIPTTDLVNEAIRIPKVPGIPDIKAEATSNVKAMAQKELEQVDIQVTEIDQAKSIKQQLDSGDWSGVEAKAESALKENVKEFQALEQQAQASQLPVEQLEEPTWDKAKVAATQQVSQVFGEQAEKIQTALQDMQGMKKKYKKVNLLNADGPVMEELDKKPIKRWQYGLQMEAKFRPMLLLNLAPAIGYKPTEKLVTGVAVSYQLQLQYQDSLTSPTHKNVSYRIFTQYTFYKNIFAHAEFEQPYKQEATATERLFKRLTPTQPKGWLGLGLTYTIYKKLKGQTQLLYNIVPPDYQAPPQNRWTVRVNLIMN